MPKPSRLSRDPTALLRALVICGLGAAAGSGVPSEGLAQERLTVEGAVARTLAQNASLRARRADSAAAEAGVAAARAGWLPRVDLSESWQRGNLPVFAFSSLLSQRRFANENFAVAALNHPDPVTNFRSAATISQSVFDAKTPLAVDSARLAQTMSETATREAEADLTVATIAAFTRALVAVAAGRAADAAVESAAEDLRRAEQRRDAGLAMEADVLDVQVHLARMEERRLQARGDEAAARAELGALMGGPLDDSIDLAELAPPDEETIVRESLERDALAARPELQRAVLDERAASLARSVARAAFLPDVSVQAAFEWNGGEFESRASGWLVGTSVRWNVFAGFGDRARMEAARQGIARATAAREALELQVRAEVRTAAARLETARAREAVGRASLARARESQRIVRDRYEAGMAAMSDVLRAANAVLDAELQRTNAAADWWISRAALRRAVGKGNQP
jgi:outer membrane protein TolC